MFEFCLLSLCLSRRDFLCCVETDSHWQKNTSCFGKGSWNEWGTGFSNNRQTEWKTMTRLSYRRNSSNRINLSLHTAVTKLSYISRTCLSFIYLLITQPLIETLGSCFLCVRPKLVFLSFRFCSRFSHLGWSRGGIGTTLESGIRQM